jgi:hypothetical protein
MVIARCVLGTGQLEIQLKSMLMALLLAKTLWQGVGEWREIHHEDSGECGAKLILELLIL